MYGKAYAIMCDNELVAFSLDRRYAQEMLMDFAFEDAYEWFNRLLQNADEKVAMEMARDTLEYWHIEIYELI